MTAARTGLVHYHISVALAASAKRAAQRFAFGSSAFARRAEATIVIISSYCGIDTLDYYCYACYSAIRHRFAGRRLTGTLYSARLRAHHRSAGIVY